MRLGADAVKTNITELDCERLNLIELSENAAHWLSFVNTMTQVRVP
jgi:hypothetical protein